MPTVVASTERIIHEMDCFSEEQVSFISEAMEVAVGCQQKN